MWKRKWIEIRRLGEPTMAKPPQALARAEARFLPKWKLDLASWNFLVLCTLALLTLGYFRAAPRVGARGRFGGVS